MNNHKKQLRQQQHITDTLNFRLSHANIPPRYKKNNNLSFDCLNFTTEPQQKILNIIKNYTQNIIECVNEGLGLIMLGNVGTGKTHLANIILYHAIIQGFEGYYCTEYDISNAIKNTYNNTGDRYSTTEYISNQFANYDLLIIDEIGRQQQTEHNLHLLYSLMLERYNNEKTTIYISNLLFNDFAKYLGVQIIDRLQQTTPPPLFFDWASGRKANQNLLNKITKEL